jgi:hypothetical protein
MPRGSRRSNTGTTQGVSHTHDIGKLRDAHAWILGKRQDGDKMLTYHRQFRDLVYFNDAVCTTQNVELKRMFREGKIVLRECNNLKASLNDTKKVYCYVVQSANPEDEVGMVPLALSLGVMVDGYAYWFFSKNNRDAMYKFITKPAKRK